MKYVCFGSVILFEKMSLVYKIIKGLIFRYDFLGLNFYNKLQVIPFHVSFLIQGHQVSASNLKLNLLSSLCPSLPLQ